MVRTWSILWVMALDTSDMGIYKIENLGTGEAYVGQSQKLTKRLQQHIYDLQRGTHSNARLQESWNEHGEAEFDLSVIEYVTSANDLEGRESHWLKELGKTNDMFNGRYYFGERKRRYVTVGFHISPSEKKMFDGIAESYGVTLPVFIRNYLMSFVYENPMFHAAPIRKCSVKDCAGKHFGLGLCNRHYKSHRRQMLKSSHSSSN